MRLRRLATALCLATSMALPAPFAQASAGAWVERVQIVHDAASNTISRQKLRVWDPSPERGLEFVWEPSSAARATAVLTQNAGVTGHGKLTWRVKGSASYDPRGVFSVYTGDMVDGRPHGRGRLEVRSGSVYEGDFVDGIASGRGVRIENDGSRYEGEFRDGVANGSGTLSLKTGEIYAGAFANGLRHGKGLTTLPGGSSYESAWSMGVESGSKRDMVADATLGGLLKAQAGGGGDAAKVEIGIAVDQRMNQESEARYVDLVRDEDIAIYPESEEMNQAWRGDGLVSTNDYYASGIDWTYLPAFVAVDLRSTDGSRFKIKDLSLQVKDSQVYRKPMLSLLGHVGCVGFRPSFSLLNHGWGGGKNASLSLKFTGEDPDNTSTSRAFTVPVADFADGVDIPLDGVLKEAGVNTDKLASERFNCQSRESLGVCRSQLMNSVAFGEVADYVWGEDKLFTTATGTINYDWSDDYGNTYQQAEQFRIDIALATIELPEEAAECGDAFGGAPDAPRYQDVKLRSGESNYAVDMPVRGNKNLKEYQARLKLHAETTSYHEFSVTARFADGSERQSKPISFYYFRPKPSAFATAMEPPPASCYLPPSSSGC